MNSLSELDILLSDSHYVIMALKIHKLSLNYLITFSLMVLLPFFLFGYFINFYYGRYLVREMETRMTETVQQLSLNLENEINGMTILSSSLIHNKDFLLACSEYNHSETPQDSYLYQEQMDSHLSNLFLSTNKIGSIYIYSGKKESYVFRNYRLLSKEPDKVLNELENFTQPRVQNNIIQIQDHFFTLFNEDDVQKEPLLSLLVIPDLDPLIQGDLKALLFAFRVDILKKLYHQSAADGYVIISNREGQILLKNVNVSLSEEILSQKGIGRHDRRWVKASSEIHATGWTIVTAYERRVLLKPFLRIRFIFNIILSGILLIFVLYTVLFFHNLITPLNNLAEKMALVEQGNYHVRIETAEGQEEMKYVQHAFNSMICQVDRLTREKEQDSREKSLLELQALQYQINPHFVANTLNSIRMMAVVNGADHIKNMTSSLMRLINDSFRNEGYKTTLAEERESLKSYVHIMKVRTGCPIDLRFSIPEHLNLATLRKMLLQPLVENAIIHGFPQGQKKGTILIQAKEQDRKLVLRITDNGIGMKVTGEKELPQNHAKGKGLTSLGIRSVQRRIQLNYGENYGLYLRSKEGFYTSLTIILPLTDQEKEKGV